MRLVTYRATVESEARLGVIVGDLVVDVEAISAKAGLLLPSSMLTFIDLGPSGLETLEEILEGQDGRFPAGTALPLANVRLLAPIPRPRKNIFGIGLNYVEHVAESARTLDTSKDLPKQPVIFSKPPTAVIGPNEAIEHNKAITQQLDWEVELAVIMGRTARRVTEADALNYVAGYCVCNDVSERNFQLERGGTWTKGKSHDTFGPVGPWLVTKDEIADPQKLGMWLDVNGERRQTGNTSTMIFTVAKCIAYVSQFMTLLPGDIVTTGTPPGVGGGMKPPKFLNIGDIVTLGIDGLGAQRQEIIAA